jgi:iron complex transport system substrate-binding protein
MQRIVSLLPSSTEIICALGCEDRLVGRSHECDFPESVRTLPSCSEPKFEPDGTSYEIDQRVKAILQEAVSVYRVDAERLQELAPDLIVTQSQCEMCAVNLKDVEEAACHLLGSDPAIVSLEPRQLEDVWRDIATVAEALDLEDRGADLVGRLQSRLDRLASVVGGHVRRPRVACLEWFEPLMSAGNWMPELVELAGGSNLFGAKGEHSPRLEWRDLAGHDPEIILLTPCGFDLETCRREMDVLIRRPEWHELEAVRTSSVFLTDGNEYFNRPGPRLVESVEIIAEILHPDLFESTHEGSGWQRWETLL